MLTIITTRGSIIIILPIEQSMDISICFKILQNKFINTAPRIYLDNVMTMKQWFVPMDNRLRFPLSMISTT